MSAATRTASGHGVFTLDAASGRVLDAWFPEPALGDDGAHAAAAGLEGLEDEIRATRTDTGWVRIDLDAAPRDAPDAYLRLHLLSHRLVAPREANLDGIFGVLA